MIKKHFFTIVAALSATISFAQPITAGEHTRVATTYGPIEGYQDGNIFTFKGIKYAKAERFMAPENPDKFETTNAILPRITTRSFCNTHALSGKKFIKKMPSRQVHLEGIFYL